MRSRVARAASLFAALALTTAAAPAASSASATTSPAEPERTVAQADTPHTELSPVSDLASEIGQLGRSKFAQIFFGVTVSRKAGEVTLYTSDATRADDLVTQARSSLVDSESRSIPVEVELVDYTREQLHKARQKLWKLASQWASTEIYTIAVNPDGTGLTATTNNPTSAQALLAETPTALAIPKASVAFEKGHPVVPMTG